MTGTLGLFSLVDLFQLLAAAKRSGRLTVEHPDGIARVYFDKGQAIHADFGELAGEDAILALFADERGNFDFRIGMPASQTTITRATENLVLDAVRQLDETRRSNQEGSVRLSREAVPMINATRPGGDGLDLSQEELLLIKHVDGKRTVTSVGAAAGLDPVRATTVTERLLKTGVIKLQNRRARTARLVTRLSTLKLPHGAVGVEVTILTAWEKALGHAIGEVACKREDGSVLVFPAVGVNSAGPFMEIARDTLFRANLKVNEPLLVRPVDAPEL